MHHAPVVIDLETARANLPFPALINALRTAFIAGAEVPLRHRHELPDNNTLLLMPAWQGVKALGVKIVTVYPRNGARGCVDDPASSRPLRLRTDRTSSNASAN